MKKIMVTVLTGTLLASAMQPVRAGDREWATAGKVLTGVFAASVVARAFEPVPVYRTEVVYTQPAPVVYSAPPPQVVYQAPTVPPAPVAYAQPAMVQQQVVYVQQPQVVYVQPAPVYYRPVCVAPVPIVRVNFGFGGHRHHGPVGYRHSR